MEGNSRDENPRPRSTSVIDRDIQQAIAEPETTHAAVRSVIADIDHYLDRLEEEYATGRDHNNASSDLLGLLRLLDIELPNLSDALQDDDIPAEISRAGAEFLDPLPDVSLDNVPNVPDCTICMEPFGSTKDHESPVQLPCCHVVGRKCISRWLETSNTCPLCRHVLFREEEENRTPSSTEMESRRRDLLRTLVDEQFEDFLLVLNQVIGEEAERRHRERLETRGTSGELAGRE